MIDKKRIFKFITIITCLVMSVFSLMIFTTKNDQPVYADSETNQPTKLNTISYICEDNNGYNIAGNRGSLFGNTPLAEISLQMTNGTILQGTKNGKYAYGYVVGNEDTLPELKVKLRYNLSISDDLKIGNTQYYISEDTWKSTINGIDGVGVVGTGALLVMKSKTGGNSSSEWSWDNKYSDTDMNCYSTVDFVNNFSPKYYSGTPKNWTTIKDVKGSKQTIEHSSDGYVTIYTPDGTEMKEGIFIKVLFAYEVKYVDSYYLSWFDIKEKWAYRNVVEETVFYICNSSVNVLFQNIVFSDSSNENKIVADTERTELIRMAGTIKSGDATIEGFKINTLGNNYKVEYKFNLSSNWKLAQNGQIFTSPGRYDFKVTSQIGNYKETTIYINERGEQQNIKKYFADGFITKESHRIFTSNATPTYVAGKTYYKINAVNENFIGLVGKIKIIKGQDITLIDENDPLYDTEKGGEQYKVTDIVEDVAILTESDCRKDWSGVLTEPGEYIAEFANNPRYFENDFSGDVYHFVFKFTLTNDEPTPNLNETLLSTNLCYFDYDPEYFGVTLNSKGQGKVTYAFSYYTDAQSFAYNYYLSQVKFENSKYIFQNKEYSSNSDVLREVYILSEDTVELRYFDPTDESTLLTIQNAQTEILNLNLQRDVVVMSDMLMPHDSATGVAFLNNKKYYYTDEDGNITKDETPVRFISIADFESNSIKLVHIESKTSINVDYGTPIETLLYHNRMPSGLYKIIETNINGYENVYYANYISKGDLKVYLTISVFDEKLEPEIHLSKSQANNRYTVKNFTLKSATNNLDNYGLIKLRKLGNTGYTKMFTLTEIENYEVKEKGSYEITLIDRIGNFAKIYIDINNAADIHNLTLVDDETNVNETKRVSVGQTIELKTLTSENSLIENIGWQDKNGNVYVNEYTFNGYTDTILNAVWQYKNTNINVYDGKNILNKISKPDETVVLPEIKVLDSSLKLYGFAYKLEDNSYIFYRGQITKVPNVESMTLNAYYVDYNQTYTNNLQSKMNMEFVGWLLETESLKGYILTDDEVNFSYFIYSSFNV